MISFLGKNRLYLAVLLVFVVFSLLLFWPIFLGKVNLNGNLLVSFYAPYSQNLPYKYTGWDQLRIYFPFYKVTLDSFRNFSVPLWNQFAFSGHPHMADFQTAVFYPLNIFAFVLSQIAFWHLLRITPTILAAFFTFIFLKNRKFSTLSSLFGAVTFGFSPYILTWGEEVIQSVHSIVWMPLILFAVDKFLAKDKGSKKIYLAIITLSTAFSLFAGYMQTTIYVYIFVFAYLVFRLWEQGKGIKSIMGIKCLGVVGAIVLGGGLAAVQLVPSGELFFNSGRSTITLTNKLYEFLIPIRGIATFLAPDFFGSPATHNFFRGSSAQYYEGIMFVGVAALVFATIAFVHARDKFVKFLAAGGFLALFSTLNLPTSKLFLHLPIPFLSTSIPNRILFISAFCLAVLGTIGFEYVLGKRDFKVFKVFFAFGLVYALALIYMLGVKFFGFSYISYDSFLPMQTAAITFRNLIIPGLVFASTLVLVYLWMITPRLKNLCALLIIVIACLHTFYFSQKYFSFSEKQYIFPNNPILDFIKNNQGIYRSWGVGDAMISDNFATQYGIYWPEGYDSLNNQTYGEFTYAMQGYDVKNFSLRSDAGLGAVGGTQELLGNENRRRLVDMVGVKYVVLTKGNEDFAAKINLKKVYEWGKFDVYENLDVMPRVALISNYEGPPDVFGEEPKTEKERTEREKQRRSLMFQKLLASDFDFKNKVILEKPSPISPQFGPGTAEVVSYKPTEVIIKTKSNQPKLLFLSDNWFSGWKAKVDSDVTPVLRADYTFRAVPLTPGEHVVRFYYDPITFKIGFLVSALSLGLLAYLIFFKNRILE